MSPHNYLFALPIDVLPSNPKGFRTDAQAAVCKELEQVSNARSPPAAAFPQVLHQAFELRSLGQLQILLLYADALKLRRRILDRPSPILLMGLDARLNHLLECPNGVVVVMACALLL